MLFEEQKPKIKLDYVPSHKTDGQYAILMETSPEEYESWYYFIRVEGNEDNLNNLKSVIESVEWSIIENCNVFDIELEHLISASTAKEFTKVDLNHTSFHRKFDGILKPINFKFKIKDKNEKKMWKIFDVLGYGQIENFIDDEDLDEEDLATDYGDDEDDEDEEDEDEDEDEDEEEDDEDDEEDEDEEDEESVKKEKKSDEKIGESKKEKEKKKYKLPPSLC